MEFKKLLKTHGLKQVNLASELGCSSQLVTNWIKRRSNPSLAATKEIARILNCSIDDVINCFTCD